MCIVFKKRGPPSSAGLICVFVMLENDDLVSLGTNRDVLDRASDQLSEALAILLGFRWQVFPLPCFGGGRHPTLELLIDRFGYFLEGCLRQVGYDLTIDPIGSTDLDLLKRIENIKLG